jgi:hypothetical protein
MDKAAGHSALAKVRFDRFEDVAFRTGFHTLKYTAHEGMCRVRVAA